MTRPNLISRWLTPIGMLLLGSLGTYAAWIRRAPSVDDPQGDAVVVHAGWSRRHEHGIKLVEQGAAPTLVLMYGHDRQETEGLCGQTDPFEVICPTPPLMTTIGEAVELRRLAAERGWRTVVTVTSDFHLRRATYLDGKLGGVTAIGSGAGRHLDPITEAWLVAREMAAMVQAIFARS